MIPRATLLFLPAVLLLACQSPSQGQTTPSPEQIQPSAGTVDPAQPTNAQPASPAAAEPTRPNFVAWRDAFKTEALAAGVSAATFDRAFDGVLPNFDILAKDDVQPEYTKPIWAYLDTAVSPEHVATGRQRLADNKAALRKATKPYGVPPQIVIAIWGLESAYGVNTGGYNVIEALATMAYGSRRPDVFRQNLIDALLILEHGDITPEDMKSLGPDLEKIVREEVRKADQHTYGWAAQDIKNSQKIWAEHGGKEVHLSKAEEKRFLDESIAADLPILTATPQAKEDYEAFAAAAKKYRQ